MFRSNLCEEVTDKASEFINLLLKKITVYRTLVFIKFYESYIQVEIETSIRQLQKRIRMLYEHVNVVGEFEELSKVTRKAVLQTFGPDKLHQELPSRQEDQQDHFQQPGTE
jgi:hypothetical protein